MLVSSALEPTGPKSSKSYLIVHHNDQHELVYLPETYSDLEAEIQDLFHIEKGQFHIVSDDLNLCRNTRIKIPEKFWADLAPLIGNVYVVPHLGDLAAVRDHPESAPAPQPRLRVPPKELPLKESDIPVTRAITGTLNNSEDIYEQIISCNDTDAAYISYMLSGIREGSVSKDTASISSSITGPASVSGRIKWHSHDATKKKWIDLKWDINRKTILVARISIPRDAAPTTSYIVFGQGRPTRDSLQITLTDMNVQIGEYNLKEGKRVISHGEVRLPHSPQAPGEHTVAFINQLGNIHVVFDFCNSVVFPNTAAESGKAGLIYFNVPTAHLLNVDVYDFGQ